MGRRKQPPACPTCCVEGGAHATPAECIAALVVLLPYTVVIHALRLHARHRDSVRTNVTAKDAARA